MAASLLAAGAAVLVWLLATRAGVSLMRPFSVLALGLGIALVLDLVLLALLIYWSIAALRLRYWLDRNGLVIHWGGSRLVVPMDRISEMRLGSDLTGIDNPVRAFRGIGWVGLRAGQAQLTGGRPARVITTAPAAESVLILTPDSVYVVSPREPRAFLEAWRVRRPLGPTQFWQEREYLAWPLDLPVWRDRLAWTLIGLGLMVSLALHIYLSVVFDQLPAMLSFHFDVLGQVDRIASRVQILRLPQIALLMLVLDLILGFAIYRRQRIAAYLVWGGGLVLQLLVWGAVLTIS